MLVSIANIVLLPQSTDYSVLFKNNGDNIHKVNICRINAKTDDEVRL